VSLLATCLYVVGTTLYQYLFLQWATYALEQGDLDTAWARVESMLTADPPLFFTKQAKILCSQILLQRARILASEPDLDFSGAVTVLRGLTQRCQSAEYEGEAVRLIEWIAGQHLAKASARCPQKDFERAFHDFQLITTPPYPERTLREAKEETIWCRLDYANTLVVQESFDAALNQYLKIISSDYDSARTAALKQVRVVVENEVLFWLGRSHYPKAFDQLRQRQQAFGEYPELVSFFPRLEGYLEEQVFGVALAQYCLEKPAHLQNQEPVPMMVNALNHNGSALMSLLLHNNTPYILSLLVRGPKQTDLHLNPSEKQRFWFEPGTYLVGVVSPGCCLKPLRTAWSIESSLQHSITFYEVQQGSQTIPQLNYQEATHRFALPEDTNHSPEKVLPPKLTREQIRSAQKRLKDRKWYTSALDGILGSQTEVALRRYQEKQGLPVTGKLDAATQKALGTTEIAEKQG
jgi:hypothetical protein